MPQPDIPVVGGTGTAGVGPDRTPGTGLPSRRRTKHPLGRDDRRHTLPSLSTWLRADEVIE